MKRIWIGLHLLLLILIADQAAGFLYRYAIPAAQTAGPAGAPETADPEVSPEALRPQPPLSMRERITRRNLFKVLIQETQPQDAGNKTGLALSVTKTSLALTLVGTVEGNQTSYAVIDAAKTGQSLFTVGDTVQGARIKKIMRNRVLLEVDGRTELLEIDPTRAPSPVPGSVTGSAPATASPLKPALFPTAGTRLMPAAANAMKQARLRPYFRNGQPDGLLIYGIRKESGFWKAGLRNGDILKEINGTRTVSSADATKIYETITAESDLQITVARHGKEKSLVYDAGTGTFTEGNAP